MNMPDLTTILPKLEAAITMAEPRRERGRLREVRGILVHASLTSARIGELCELRDPVSGRIIMAEVIGFEDSLAVLSIIGDIQGLSGRCEVIPTGQTLSIPVGEYLLGRVIDPLGISLSPGATDTAAGIYYPAETSPIPAMERAIIERPLSLGVRAIDGVLTVARGQRIGIFGEPGAGKSSLLASIVRHTAADVVVVGLIGERGREVREFVDVLLGPRDRERTVTIVATSDRPAIERVKAAYTATAVAEYFRDQGKDVLLLMDSLTRFARAQREIGLAAGEPPTRRGFPPSFFTALPRLLERAGPGRPTGGSITALYTVLVEGDGTLDPVAEEAKSILDGHIVLSPDLAQRNHYPAIDVLKSRSRLMGAVTDARHRELAARLRASMADYAEIELLLTVGEYTHGDDPRFDEAINRHSAIQTFLRQSQDEHADIETTIDALEAVFA